MKTMLSPAVGSQWSSLPPSQLSGLVASYGSSGSPPIQVNSAGTSRPSSDSHRGRNRGRHREGGGELTIEQADDPVPHGRLLDASSATGRVLGSAFPAAAN